MRRGWSPGTLTAWTAGKGRAGEGGTRILVFIRKKEKEELVVDAAEKPNTEAQRRPLGMALRVGLVTPERVVGWYTQMKDRLVNLGAKGKEGPGIWKGSGCGL